MFRTLYNPHNVHRDFQSERWWTFQGYYFLFPWTVVIFSVVVALLGVNFNTILRGHFLLLLLIFPLLIFNIQWTLLIITPVIGSIVCIALALFLFSFSIKSPSNFMFLIKPLSTPNSASPSRNVFSTRSLVTSLLHGDSTYSTSSAMFMTGIMCLFRSNCPRGFQKYFLITPIFRNCQKNSGEASVGVNLERKEWKVLSCLICLMGTYSVF